MTKRKPLLDEGMAAELSAREMTFIGELFDQMNDFQLASSVEHSHEIWTKMAEEIYKRSNGNAAHDDMKVSLELDSRECLLMLTAFKAMCTQALYHRVKEHNASR